MSWNDIETMLSGFAYDAYYNQNETSKKNYFTVFDYAIDQGFAYGSGMGTNHHYGYQVRKIYTTAWLMRDAIYKHPHRDAYLSTLRFWAALQETRQPCSPTRDELLDSWHTLLMAKFISAMMFPRCKRTGASVERFVTLAIFFFALYPGTIGGIKVDGTTFHHGGFYPGYTTGVLATVGEYIAFTNGTSFELTEDARKHMKSAFIAMRNYCNFYEWGIGISGRHPFGGKMGSDDIEAFANIALSGDLSGQGNTFDRGLAADYLRLIRNSDTPECAFLQEGRYSTGTGSTGILRLQLWFGRHFPSCRLDGDIERDIPLTYGVLKFIRKITVTDVIRVMAPCRLWGKEIPCHVPEAVLCRRDGTGTVCRVQLPFICLSICLIAH